jgi:tRNA(Ile2) C34 agmatinyltransferase TiaS
MTATEIRLKNLVGPCPDCGNGRMTAAVDVEGTTNFRCRECGTCLHAELEWIRRVDPESCAGCDARAACAALAARGVRSR